MSVIRNLPVSRKFLFAFGIVCALCIGLAIYGFITFRSIASQAVEVSESTFPSTVYVGEARTAINTMRREDLHLLLCAAPTCIADESTRRDAAVAAYKTAENAYEPLIDSTTERESFEKTKSSFQAYLVASDHAMALMKAGKTGDAMDLLFSAPVRSAIENSLEFSNENLKLNTRQGLDSAHQIASFSRGATWINTSVNLIIVVLCAIIGFFLTREIAPASTESRVPWKRWRARISAPTRSASLAMPSTTASTPSAQSSSRWLTALTRSLPPPPR